MVEKTEKKKFRKKYLNLKAPFDFQFQETDSVSTTPNSPLNDSVVTTCFADIYLIYLLLFTIYLKLTIYRENKSIYKKSFSHVTKCGA